MLLLTDGQANVGITEPAALVSMATSARGAGVGTTTIGFGDHFAEELLTDMGDAGGGNAHFAPTPDAAPAIFAEEFEGLASVVAQNVSIEIRPGGDVDLVEVLNHYPATPVAGGVQLALGDAYGGERRSVVFALQVPALAQLGMAKVADVVLRYVSVGDQIAAHELTLPLMVNVVSADEAASAQADHAVVEEVVVLEAAKPAARPGAWPMRATSEAGRRYCGHPPSSCAKAPPARPRPTSCWPRPTCSTAPASCWPRPPTTPPPASAFTTTPTGPGAAGSPAPERRVTPL